MAGTQWAIQIIQGKAEDERRKLQGRPNQYALHCCDRAVWHLERRLMVYLTGHAAV